MLTTERKNDLPGRIDNPLVDPEEDRLDRKKLAERIFTLIKQSDTHLRVGILGPWGSGKTTVLNFIKNQCEKENPVAFFYPWQFSSREDAWTGFVSSLDSALASWGKLPVGSFKRKRIIKNMSEKTRRLAEIVNTNIGKAIGDLILAPLENQLAESKKNVNKELKKILGDEKRFYIFIDDLDRSEPDIVYEMLMLLNEIVDLDRCIYIIGLDVRTISEVLRNKLGYTNPKDFIDKIINWPFELPIPSSLDWKILLDKEYEKIKSSGVRKDVITGIIEILPKNPRKFKYYLRYLGGLHQAFLNQLDDNARDWELLYLCQLLNLEFPSIFRDLRQNNEIINDLAFGKPINSDLANMSWEDKIKKELEKYEDIDAPRLFEIYQAIREKMIPYHDPKYSHIAPERIKKHLFVIEEIELITDKEYREYKEELLFLDDKGIKHRLKERITDITDSKNIERIREFMKMLLQEKDQIYEHLTQLDSGDEMQAQFNKCRGIIRICNLLTDIDNLYQKEKLIFDETTFMECYNSLLLQNKLEESGDSFEELRNKQTKLLLKVVKKNLSFASEMCEWLYGELENSSGNKAIQEIRKNVRDDLHKELANKLLDRLYKKDGIKEVFLDSTRLKTERDLLFKGNSPFYSEESYKKLKAIADKAKKNDIVYANFFHFLKTIWKPMIEESTTVQPNDELKEIMQRSKFFKVIWKAVVCRQLSVQHVSMFEEAIKNLLTKKIIEKDYFGWPK